MATIQENDLWEPVVFLRIFVNCYEIVQILSKLISYSYKIF